MAPEHIVELPGLKLNFSHLSCSDGTIPKMDHVYKQFVKISKQHSINIHIIMKAKVYQIYLKIFNFMRDCFLEFFRTL